MRRVQLSIRAVFALVKSRICMNNRRFKRRRAVTLYAYWTHANLYWIYGVGPNILLPKSMTLRDRPIENKLVLEGHITDCPVGEQSRPPSDPPPDNDLEVVVEPVAEDEWGNLRMIT